MSPPANPLHIYRYIYTLCMIIIYQADGKVISTDLDESITIDSIQYTVYSIQYTVCSIHTVLSPDHRTCWWKKKSGWFSALSTTMGNHHNNKRRQKKTGAINSWYTQDPIEWMTILFSLCRDGPCHPEETVVVGSSSLPLPLSLSLCFTLGPTATCFRTDRQIRTLPPLSVYDVSVSHISAWIWIGRMILSVGLAYRPEK